MKERKSIKNPYTRNAMHFPEKCKWDQLCHVCIIPIIQIHFIKSCVNLCLLKVKLFLDTVVCPNATSEIWRQWSKAFAVCEATTTTHHLFSFAAVPFSQRDVIQPWWVFGTQSLILYAVYSAAAVKRPLNEFLYLLLQRYILYICA